MVITEPVKIPKIYHRVRCSVKDHRSIGSNINWLVGWIHVLLATSTALYTIHIAAIVHTQHSVVVVCAQHIIWLKLITYLRDDIYDNGATYF